VTDHLYREIDDLRTKNERLSAALADMITMYEAKKRDGLRLGRARAALTMHGKWPESPATVGAERG
jgi:hypothetical protein